MNIFDEDQSILGKDEQTHLKNTLEEFYTLASTIRYQLRKQSYLLDKYLYDLLNAINATLAYDAAIDGFEITSELIHLCNKMTRGEACNKEHPLYPFVKEYIENHPLPYQEHETKVSLYCIALNDTFLEYAVPAFVREKKKAIRREMDIPYIKDLYRQISAILGSEEQMERLNLLIRQRFMVATSMDGFVQGVTNNLLYSLTSRDVESGRTVLQLCLEG